MSKNSELILLENAMAQLRVAAIAVESNLKNIEHVLEERANGNLEEPDINLAAIPDSEEDFTDLKNLYEEYVVDNIVTPFEENIERFNNLAARTQTQFKVDEPIFNLSYGPPKASTGSFILSNDGLYYDSVNGGIPEVSGYAAASSTWNLSQAPNLGGKGHLYGTNQYEEFENTVLDFDYTNNEPLVKQFYDSDDILQTFEKNKIQHTTLIHDQIALLEASGFASDSAMVVNHYSNIAAIASNYDTKIKKRKKHLQLIALFASDTFSFTTASTDPSNDPKDLGIGAGVLIQNVSETDIPSWQTVERVPLNDFSFLKGKGINVPLKAQEDLLLFSEDLDDIILPLTPVFVETPKDKFSVIDKFSVTPTSPETFPYFDGEKAVSATPGLVQSLSESIVTEGLLLGYNFIKPTVVDASSNEFNVDNITPDSGRSLNGQLVGPSIGEVFPSGLSIPKLNGTYNGGSPSYVRLPSNYKPDGTEQVLTTQELDNLFYEANSQYDKETKKGGGVTFDCWVHVPAANLTTTAAHRYKIIAACENSGGQESLGTGQGKVYGNRTNISDGRQDDTKVHGMMIGFRDAGGVYGTSGLEFFVSPTVSQNQNAGDFGHSVCLAENVSSIDLNPSKDVSAVATPSIYNANGPGIGSFTGSAVSVNGVSINDVSSSFVHVAVVFDFENNKLNTYFDAELLSSSSLSFCFDLSGTRVPNIPTFTRAVAADTTTNPYAESWQNSDKTGPVVGNLGLGYTPWILGGGFTDGIGRETSKSTYDPGFLGYNTNNLHGNPTNNQHKTTSNTAGMAGSASTRPVSGLGGFIGSFKLYSKALSNTEVRKNYTFQKGFFKNIKIS
jgi:hypothetical protein